MLVQLIINDIVLIDKVVIEFQPGLTVLTGETGAGKSILLDALSLGLGARGDGGLVRNGQKSGKVQAVFELDKAHPAIEFLQERDLLDGEQAGQDTCEVIASRVQNSDGRTRASINGNPVPATILRELGGYLVEFHGQHDDRALLDTDTHRDLLDAFGGLEPLRNEVADHYKNWKNCEKKCRQLETDLANVRQEAQYLRDSLEELRMLDVQVGEESELADKRRQMMEAEKIATELSEAQQTLGDKASPLPVLSSLIRKLERKNDQTSNMLDGLIHHLDQAIEQLYLASSELDEIINRSEYDPGSLERVEERLFALRAAGRKYNVPVENLPEITVNFADQLDGLDHGEEELAVAKQALAEAKERYFELAERLSDQRRNESQRLQDEIGLELPSLKLGQAKFLVQLNSDENWADASGIDRAEFYVQTNPQTRAGPIFKTASGGELSRFLLALKVVLADRGSAPCLVFDEIDTGVGGAVADAMGKRLARLANEVQVLAITHAPQVAALAHHHKVISKHDSGGHANTTQIISVDKNDRLDELARMLSGAQTSDEARAAAQKLLDGAG